MWLAVYWEQIEMMYVKWYLNRWAIYFKFTTGNNAEVTVKYSHWPGGQRG